MAKSQKTSDAVQMGLSKNTRRLTAEVRSHWSNQEQHSRRRLATLLHRQLAFIAVISH